MQYNSVILTIATVNFDNLVKFYIQILEQQPKKLIPNVYSEFTTTGLTLGIFKPKENHESEFANNSKSPISLCLEVNDLKNAIAQLHTLGYPPLGEITTASHGQEIYAYDPDGNRLILHQSHRIIRNS